MKDAQRAGVSEASDEELRSESPRQPPPEVGDLSAKNQRNEQWNDTLESLDTENHSL